VGGEAEDRWARAALRRNNAVPVLVTVVMVGFGDNAASACHVALAGEDEDLFAFFGHFLVRLDSIGIELGVELGDFGGCSLFGVGS